MMLSALHNEIPVENEIQSLGWKFSQSKSFYPNKHVTKVTLSLMVINPSRVSKPTICVGSHKWLATPPLVAVQTKVHQTDNTNASYNLY